MEACSLLVTASTVIDISQAAWPEAAQLVLEELEAHSGSWEQCVQTFGGWGVEECVCWKKSS